MTAHTEKKQGFFDQLGAEEIMGAIETIRCGQPVARMYLYKCTNCGEVGLAKEMFNLPISSGPLCKVTDKQLDSITFCRDCARDLRDMGRQPVSLAKTVRIRREQIAAATRISQTRAPAWGSNKTGIASSPRVITAPVPKSAPARPVRSPEQLARDKKQKERRERVKKLSSDDYTLRAELPRPGECLQNHKNKKGSKK